MKKNHFLFVSIFCLLLSLSFMKAQSNNFTGSFSSEGEITASGTLTMDLRQTGAKLEGTSNYKTYDGQLDTGVLSVNGYVKKGIGYIRFRDQRGNTLADATINFKDSEAIKFSQTTRSNQLPGLTYLYYAGGNSMRPPAQVSAPSKNFGGNYSSEGDVQATGTFKMEITQSGSKIEGTANYKSYDQQLDTGLLSINGYVKGGRAYIRVRDQRGNTVADGSLDKTDNATISFSQTTDSALLPHIAYLYK